MNFADMKVLVSSYTGLEQDALHVHVALVLYLAALLLFRRKPRSPLPWFFVLAVELGNEGYDLWQQSADGEPPRPAEGLKDLWNTMLWPSVLLLVARYTHLFGVPERAAPALESDETA